VHQPLGADLRQRTVGPLYRERGVPDIYILVGTTEQALRVADTAKQNLNPHDRLVGVYATITRFVEGGHDLRVRLVAMDLNMRRAGRYTPDPDSDRNFERGEVILLEGLRDFGEVLDEERGNFGD
jgi:hypothetical protein